MNAASERIVVIGGGIAGLASAALLARDGHRVTLLEARDELGGRAGTWERRGFRFDTGPSWYLMPEVFDHFFRLFGTSAAEQLDLAPARPRLPRVLRRLRGADRRAGVARRERRPLRVGRAGRRARRSSATSTPPPRRTTSRDGASSTRTSTTCGRSPRPRCSAARGASRDCSPRRSTASRRAPCSDRRLRQVLGYPAVFLGSSPSATPAMYHLMSHMDLEQGVLYPRGGFGELIDRIAAIAEAAGVDVITNARVEAIDLTADATPSVTGVRYRDARGATHRVAAHRVVSAADLHHTETELLPRRAQTVSRVVVAATHLGTRSRARHARRPRRGAGARAPHAVLHRGLVDELRATSSATTRGSPTLRRSTSACRARATRPSLPRATRTSSCWSRCPPTSRSAAAASDGAGDRLVEEAADRAIARIAAASGLDRPRAARRGAPDRGPGRLRRGPALVAGRRPRPRAHPAAERVPARHATDRAACADCSTPVGRACRASACRCA